MARRKGEIHEAVAKYFHLGVKGYIVIAERGTASGSRRISFDEVKRVAADRIILENDVVIPLHRVLYIIDDKGKILWSRYSEKGRGGEHG